MYRLFFVAQTPVTTEWPAEWDMILRQPLFRRVSETTPPEMGAGTEKRRSDRPAENNRPYVAERVSHIAASRETVLTVSAPTGFKSRLLLGNPPNPLKKSRKDWCNERSQEQKFIYPYERKRKKYHSAERQKVRAFIYSLAVLEKAIPKIIKNNDRVFTLCRLSVMRKRSPHSQSPSHKPVCYSFVRPILSRFLPLAVP